MTNVMGSTDKAEIGSAYINDRETVPIGMTLAEMGHPQPSMLAVCAIQLNGQTDRVMLHYATKQMKVLMKAKSEL
jgi:hypothetical protein